MSADAAPPAEALASKLADLDAGGSAEASRIPPGPPETSLPDPECDTAKRLDAALVSAGAAKARCWVRVPANYYDEPLPFRAACVKAPSVEHMCKTICMENTKCEGTAPIPSTRDCTSSSQYTAVFPSEAGEVLTRSTTGRRTSGRSARASSTCGQAGGRVAFDGVRARRGGSVRTATASRRLCRRIASLPGGVAFLGGGEYDLKMETEAATVDCTYDDEP